MPAFIHHIATALPEFSYTQSLLCERMMAWAPNVRARRIIKKIFDCSEIERRFSVCGDFQDEMGGALFRTLSDGLLEAPGTAERNQFYTRTSRDLAVKLARQTLAECGQFSTGEVTHVIFASCTGFANPGPDYFIVRELGLPATVERYTVGFMGCYAAVPALRMAAAFCAANPRAVVLVMCLELCSLHLNVSEDPDSMVANSLFADGAACAVVSARPPADGGVAYRLDGFHSALIPDGEAHMAWEIGNHGFNMVLSSYVPSLIGANLKATVSQALEQRSRSLEEIAEWAVHPGGRAILDKVEASLALDAEDLSISREVLREHGNMSSATILFVLKKMLASPGRPGALALAMAFGPGLTLESAILERVGCPLPSTAARWEKRPLMMEAMSI